MFDPIRSDPETTDLGYPASLALITVPSGNDQLVGRAWLTQGRGPHPTILLLHGLPGVEQNFDLAHTFCRAGWNVVTIHYRGSWGSTGSYSFEHSLQDAETMVNFLQTAEAQQRYRIDMSRLVMVGHSSGGFLALMTAAQTMKIAGVASIAGLNYGMFVETIRGNPTAISDTVNDWDAAMPPLRGTTAESLVNELLAHGEEWNILRYVSKLLECAVLLVAGRQDVAVPANLNHEPLVEALLEANHSKLTHVLIDSGHGFTDKRITLMETLLAWLGTLDISPAKHRQRPVEASDHGEIRAS
jgi:uncharacterized protein